MLVQEFSGVQPTRFVHPFAPTLYAEATDVDQIQHLLVKVKEQIDELRNLEYDLRRHMGRMVTGDQKTQRLRGQKYEAKLEFPDSGFRQAVLKKEVWANFPEFCEGEEAILRIETLGVNRRNYKKMLTTTGDARYEAVKALLRSAEYESESPPTVTVTRIGENLDESF